jgi:hydrogenase maturation factor HypF (carbamoyltransferase family)
MILTLNLLTITIVAPPSNASKWQMGFNSAFKGLNEIEDAILSENREI